MNVMGEQEKWISDFFPNLCKKLAHLNEALDRKKCTDVWKSTTEGDIQQS